MNYKEHTITWPLDDGTAAVVKVKLPLALGHPVIADERPRALERGLGDTIAKLTKAVGIKPCGGCKDRQAKLNRIIPYAR